MKGFPVSHGSSPLPPLLHCLVVFFILVAFKALFSPQADIYTPLLGATATILQKRVLLPTLSYPSRREAAACRAAGSLSRPKFGDSTNLNSFCPPARNPFLTAGKSSRKNPERSCFWTFCPGFSPEKGDGNSTPECRREHIDNLVTKGAHSRNFPLHSPPLCGKFARHETTDYPCRFVNAVDFYSLEVHPNYCVPDTGTRLAAACAFPRTFVRGRLDFAPQHASGRVLPAFHCSISHLKHQQSSPQKMLFLDPLCWAPLHEKTDVHRHRLEVKHCGPGWPSFSRASSTLWTGKSLVVHRARAGEPERSEQEKGWQPEVQKENEKPRRRRRAWKARGQVPDQDLDGFVSKRRGNLPTVKANMAMKEKPPRLSSGLTSLLHVHQKLMTTRQPPSQQTNPFLDRSPWTVGYTKKATDLPQSASASSLPREDPSSESIADSTFLKAPTDLEMLASVSTHSAVSPALVAALQDARIRAQGANAPAYQPVPVGPAQIPVPDGGWGRLHVVGGRLGGRRLMMPRRGDVRPMMAKVKEALFSMLQRMGVLGCVGEQQLRVLDLFSGSGALSVEAFSRGAQWALLTDSSLDSCEAATVNMQYCGVAERSYIVRASVEELLLVPERYMRLPNQLVDQTRVMRTIRKLCKERVLEAQTLLENLRTSQGLSSSSSKSDSDSHVELGDGVSRDALTQPEHEPRVLAEVGSTSSGRLLERLVNEALITEKEFGREHTYGLVFLCPPYTKVVYKDLIQLLLDCCIVGDDAVIVVEYPKEIGCLPYLIRSEASSAALVGLRNRAYGRTCIAVYCKQKFFSVAELAHLQRSSPSPTCMHESLTTGENLKVASACGDENFPVSESHESNTNTAPSETAKQAQCYLTVPRRSGVHADRAALKNLLPVSSLWYGQQRPEEFVPLGMRRQQLVAEGWIEKKPAAGRRRTTPDKLRDDHDPEPGKTQLD
ncbi:putative methyltransferase [Toxoplasma gondii VEG]|uniref:Methyltransferase n=2 Tax=Toxoplasma gondii (strain ATCC 50861 / VEG) TaxID=432359 RepID=V4ZQQ9_TOXGV|nr:putative methyltransferase [Toxoplasma gondii VEG]